MAYFDEEFLKQQRAEENYKEQKEQQIKFNGNAADGKIELYGKEILFEKREFLDGKLSFFMPYDLRPMTDDEINGAYLVGNRPQFFYCSDMADMSFVLNHTENPVPDNQIVKMAGIAGRLLERATMNGKVYAKRNFERNGKTVASLELVTHGLDGAIFSLNFYISLEDRLLLGTISCPAKETAVKKELAMQILETIEINEVDDGEYNISEH